MKLAARFFNFSAYLAQYVGIGFISGGAVHYTIDPIFYGAVGVIGAVMFVLGKAHLHRAELGWDLGSLGVVAMSLVLSFGIGIASGGVQHFGDVGSLGPVFIGLGVFLAALGYTFVEMRERSWPLVGIAAVLGLIIFFSTQFLVAPAGHMSGSGHHGAPAAMDHGAMVKTERDFLTGMVPHHQEAVDTATRLLQKSTDPVLREFLNNVVRDQSAEIVQMKSWYKNWYGEDYRDTGSYAPMMRAVESSTAVAQYEAIWLADMVGHHQGALQMAEAVLRIPGIHSETRTLADNIIRTQTAEIQTMQNMQKTRQAVPVAPAVDTHGNSDGHH